MLISKYCHRYAPIGMANWIRWYLDSVWVRATPRGLISTHEKSRTDGQSWWSHEPFLLRCTHTTRLLQTFSQNSELRSCFKMKPEMTTHCERFFFFISSFPDEWWIDSVIWKANTERLCDSKPNRIAKNKTKYKSDQRKSLSRILKWHKCRRGVGYYRNWSLRNRVMPYYVSVQDHAVGARDFQQLSWPNLNSFLSWSD